ncbi:RNA polymerase sigma factor [Pseudarthrobacter sp. Y6]|uniref:RNA polymerase sigma factor n=1 Tax=Pseudarthrobacter sp. Y6 TaxID=3418422 RepID=UPI003CF31E2B
MGVQALRKERGDLNREQRFLAVHAATHDRIYRYFRRRTDGPATAEDLCSEVFKIVWEKSTQDDSLSVMVLFGVAKNVLRNHDRSLARAANLLGILRRERNTTETEPPETPLLEALGHLSPGDREVLLLSYWDGLSSSEISDLLDTSATAIRMRLHRARKVLSNVIQAEKEGVEK